MEEKHILEMFKEELEKLNDLQKQIIKDYHKHRKYYPVSLANNISVEYVRRVVNAFTENLFSRVENNCGNIVQGFYDRYIPDKEKIHWFYLLRSINHFIPYIFRNFEHKCLICGSKMQVGYDCPVCDLSSLQNCSDVSYKLAYIGRMHSSSSGSDTNLVFYIKKNKLRIPVVKDLLDNYKEKIKHMFEAYILLEDKEIEKYLRQYREDKSIQGLETTNRLYSYNHFDTLVSFFRKSRHYNVLEGFVVFQKMVLEKPCS